MVKRPKSPDIQEDVRLFAVWIPYPLNPNWVFEEDKKACANWVAEVICNEYDLISIHQKPSSRGVILLEISKSFTEQKRLLGEHQWSLFLKNATSEEKGRKTCVYYSVYSTTREARKDGWRPFNIPTTWFEKWIPGKDRIVYPYPETKYCPLPPEDLTGKPICRHLPVELKPPLPKGQNSPVVGSTTWVAKQEKGPFPEGLNDTWQRPLVPASPMPSSSTIDNKSPITGSPAFARSPASTQTRGAFPMKGMVQRGKPIPLQQFRSEGRNSHRKSQASWAEQAQPSPSTLKGMKSPFAEKPPEKPGKPQIAWKKPLIIVPEKPPKVITSTSSANIWEEGSSTSWFDMVEEEGCFKTSDANTNVSPQETPPPSPGSTSGKSKTTMSPETTETTIHADLDQDSDDEEDFIETILVPLGNLSFSNGTGHTATEGSSASSKKPHNEEAVGTEWDEENKEKEKEPEILCPTHGPACAKKICLDYQKLFRDREKKKKIEEREKKPKKKNGNGSWRDRKGRE